MGHKCPVFLGDTSDHIRQDPVGHAPEFVDGGKDGVLWVGIMVGWFPSDGSLAFDR